MIKSNIEKFTKFLKKNFTPKLMEVMKKRYTKTDFRRDAIAALTVAVVSIPLAMAFAIASGVSPAQGLYTAIVAGFFVSLLGGSRYQIGGPTGAFIIIILGVLQQHGFDGLLMTMIMAGLILIIAGFLRLGTYIKYIPYPVVTGFTAGIGVILISTQIKDLFGLSLEVPAPFVAKWVAYFKNLGTMNWYTVFISVVAFVSIMTIKKRWPKSPFYLISVVLSTIFVVIFSLPVDTIGSKFGEVPHFLPAPSFPSIDVSDFFSLLPSAFTIAFLAGIESLLSAKVVDGMSGDNHNPNAELIAQGTANIASACFMGLPATGAIARTATNYKANAYSPVAGILHTVFILLFMVALASVAGFIPLACLSVVMIIIGWNMLSLDKMYKLMKAPRGDRNTLIVTFLLTVLVDLNTAISVGFIMAAIIFMHRMSHQIAIANDDKLSKEKLGGQSISDNLSHQGIVAFRVSGPLFFGGVSEVSQFFSQLQTPPRILILRMGQVPMVDASGANLIAEFVKKLKSQGTKVIICNIKKQPRDVLHTALLQEHINWKTLSVAKDFPTAVKIASRYVRLNPLPSPEK